MICDNCNKDKPQLSLEDKQWICKECKPKEPTKSITIIYGKGCYAHKP